MNGWVFLHKKFLKWEWYSDINTKCLFIHFLLNANWKDTKWRGIELQRGQFVTGLFSLTEETGLTIRQIRTAIDKLTLTGEITQKTTNKYRIITVIKYSEYQQNPYELEKQEKEQVDNQATNKRQTNDNSLININNINNILPSASEAFSSKEYIDKLINDKQRHIKIIGLYFSYTRKSFPTKKAAESELRRWLADARVLADYTDEQIATAQNYVEKKFPDLWNLSTVKKFINQ